jgi:hypothetical protein
VKSSRFKGVSWASYGKHGGRWQSYILVNKKQIHVGMFSDEEEAARARDKAWLEAGGTPSQLNFVKREESDRKSARG